MLPCQNIKYLNTRNLTNGKSGALGGMERSFLASKCPFSTTHRESKAIFTVVSVDGQAVGGGNHKTMSMTSTRKSIRINYNYFKEI
jgi:hypothetical protein